MPSSVFSDRRKTVLETMRPGALILPSARTAIRNNDVEHDYRQDSDLFYLTGFAEPESVLVLSTQSEGKAVLFVRARNPAREVWDGARAGVEGAVSEYGVDEAYPISELATRLPDLLEGCERIYYELGCDRDFDDRVLAAVATTRARGKLGVIFPTEVISPSVVVHSMRLLKAPEELDAMRRAVRISEEAHIAAMKMTRPGMREYEVEAAMMAIFRKHGCERPAYGPIVGSGPNATVLHYRSNDRLMQDGDLLLIDAGAEYGYYASDITRTFPVGGRFSDAQRKIYDVVLRAQLECIAAVKPGATRPGLQEIAARCITEGLVALGIISGSVEDAIEQKSYMPFYMHGVTHYLGMDVHDVGPYFHDGKPSPFQAGTVITVEPGIYISADAEVPDEFRGIGIRIEDDVLVTKTETDTATAGGAEVLSDGVPKSADEIEALCAS
jgi:Xaa-Pro aminopeptidase